MKNFKKVLLSGMTIGIVAVVALVATNAYFSDTETSTGNLFAAGDIDLKISNESYALDCNIPGSTTCNGALVASTANTWQSSDLADQLFFNFTDLKPGDFGEDTIDIVVGSNDAWACMAVDMTSTPENVIVDPEADAGDVTDGINGGELQNYLEFAWWVDDGDNVFEVGEELGWTGRANELFNGTWQRLVDSTGGFFGNNPLPGGQTVYLAKAWCFGELTQAPVAIGAGTPVERGTGFTCNGAGDQNDAQTDSIVADISFYAVQARSNGNFLCSNLPPFVGGNVEEELIGAALGNYTQPVGEACNLTVDNDAAVTANNYHTIQAAVDVAANGNTICVDDDIYAENVNINKPLTLAGNGATATSVINGVGGNQTGAVMINANDVTVKGFEINSHSTGLAAIFVNQAVSGVVLNSNKVNVNSPDGLVSVGGVTNMTVSNNEFVGVSNASRLVYVNGLASVNVASDNVDFLNNTFGGVLTGTLAFGHEASNSVVNQNVFDLSPSYAVLEAWMDSIALHENNFNGAGGIKVAQMENGQTGAQGTVNAENNWWGAAVPAGHISGDVDDNPKAAVAFPEN